jgi:stage IV sporulation protein FB
MKLHLSPATLLYFATSLLLCHDLTLAAILSAIMIHELSHLIALRLTGGNATSVTITPMGLTLERIGLLSHRNEIIVSLSAPIVNLLLAFVFSHCQLAPCTYQANLGFGLINLLPIYPLDGGKALYALLSRIVRPSNATLISNVISHIFLFIFWMLGIAVALVLNGGLSMLMLSVGLFITVAPMCNSNK